MFENKYIDISNDLIKIKYRRKKLEFLINDIENMHIKKRRMYFFDAVRILLVISIIIMLLKNPDFLRNYYFIPCLAIFFYFLFFQYERFSYQLYIINYSGEIFTIRLRGKDKDFFMDGVSYWYDYKFYAKTK